MSDGSDVLWGDRPAGRRGPRATMTPEAIALAAIEIADSEGLAAATMQRVAEALGVTKMALYRYVPGKAELVALMVDHSIGAPPGLDTIDGGWRPRLVAWTHALYERFAQHPWALEATAGPRPVGPNELGWLEVFLAALDGTGLEGGERLDLTATLTGQVRSIVQQEAAAGTVTPEQSAESAFAALVHGREEDFPALLSALASSAEHDGHDQALDFGVGVILDGVERLIERRSSGQRTTPRGVARGRRRTR